MTKILELPFDEPIGSVVAQDFSGFGRDATLVNDFITTGRQGNSLFARALGSTHVPSNPLNLNSDYTIYFWVMSGFDAQSSHTMRGYVTFDQLDDFALQLDFDTPANSWTLLTLTKEGSVYKTYSNGILTDQGAVPTNYTASGIYFLKDYLVGNIEQQTDGSYIDSFTVLEGEVFNVRDIRDLIFDHTTKLAYKIEGQDLKDLGWTVEDARGLTGRSASKAESFDWADRHGIAVDVFNTRFKERKIELDIWQRFETKEDAIDGTATFKELISRDGLFRFEFTAGSRSIAYQVFSPGDLDFEIKKWVEGKVVAKTTLVMVEPEPVKKILQFVRTGADNKTATVTFNSNKDLFNIYWGDGSYTPNVSGAPASASHEYQADGEYYIIVAGVIENMTAFASNTVVVWPKFI